MLEQVQTKPQRLTKSEVAARQTRYGSNLLKPRKKSGNLTLLIGQFKSPIISVVPGDCLILESKDLFINEATLTGEKFPVEKSPGINAADAPLGQRLNTLFMATHVVSGNAKEEVGHVQEET